MNTNVFIFGKTSVQESFAGRILEVSGMHLGFMLVLSLQAFIWFLGCDGSVEGLLVSTYGTFSQ